MKLPYDKRAPECFSTIVPSDVICMDEILHILLINPLKICIVLISIQRNLVEIQTGNEQHSPCLANCGENPLYFGFN